MLPEEAIKKQKPQKHNDIPLGMLQWLESKNLIITSVTEGMEKLEPSDMAGGIVKWWNHFGREFASSSKILNRITVWARNSLIYTQEN